MRTIFVIPMLFLICCFPCIVEANPPGALAPEVETIVIAVDEWPPFQSSSARFYGGAHRIISEAFELSGIKVEFMWLPWQRALILSRLGKVAGAALSSRTPERERTYYFSEPIMTVKKVFFHLKTFDFNWREVGDLTGIEIGFARGNVFGKAFEEARKAGALCIQQVPSQFVQNFRKLINNRIQLFPAELDAGLLYLKNNLPAEADLITYHPTPLQVVTYHLILSRKVSGNREITERFNSGLRKLKASGKAKRYLLDSMEGKYRAE